MILIGLGRRDEGWQLQQLRAECAELMRKHREDQHNMEAIVFFCVPNRITSRVRSNKYYVFCCVVRRIVATVCVLHFGML